MRQPSDSALFRNAVEDLKKARPPSPDWLAAVREEAAVQFKQVGFPAPKDEAWRFTPVRPLTGIAFEPARPVAMEHPAADAADAASAVIHNGRVQLSGKSPPGVWLGTLAQAMEEHTALLESHLGRVVRKDDGFVAVNTALFSDALVLVVAPGTVVAEPIQILHSMSAEGAPVVAYGRILLVVGRDAEASVLEIRVRQGEAQHLENTVTEVVLADNARLEHVRFRAGDTRSFAVESLGIRQSRDSRYASRVVTLGGALTRVGLDVELAGEGAECKLEGLFMADSGEHVDHHVHITHAVPHCRSNQCYKGIVDGSGTGVFDGIVVVARGAQKTEAHQQSRNLLLSSDATLHTKPHLEIDADDVRCSHGATVGRLDADQLFYLRSRGIDEPIARAALTLGFAREILDGLPADVAGIVNQAVMRRLPHGELAGELSE